MANNLLVAGAIVFALILLGIAVVTKTITLMLVIGAIVFALMLFGLGYTVIESLLDMIKLHTREIGKRRMFEDL